MLGRSSWEDVYLPTFGYWSVSWPKMSWCMHVLMSWVGGLFWSGGLAGGLSVFCLLGGGRSTFSSFSVGGGRSSLSFSVEPATKYENDVKAGVPQPSDVGKFLSWWMLFVSMENQEGTSWGWPADKQGEGDAAGAVMVGNHNLSDTVVNAGVQKGWTPRTVSMDI